MTEYGRGQGSEPWDPEDPLYGDGGWGGQQAHPGRQSPYGGQPQHYPEQPQQPQYDDGGWGDGRQAAYGQAQQHDPQQYQQQHDPQQYQQQHDPQYQQQDAPQQYQQHDPQQYQQQYGEPQYDQQYGQQHDPHQHPAQQQDQPQQQYDDGSWGTGTHTQVPYSDPSDPYGQQAMSYGGEQPDYYGTPDAYPPPEPPARRRAEPEPQTDWDPGSDQGEDSFFAGGGDDDDADPGDRRGRGDRKGRGAKEKKRRNGFACLVVVLVLGGGVGGVGYFGYQFYQNRFGTAPDYAGNGTNESVTVQIPKGAFGSTIGRKLKEAGVVKSIDAFVAAQQQNPKGETIQAGAYILKKEMSAESALAMMLDPKSQNNVLVRPGERNISVYQAIDDKLDLSAGTTRKTAEKKFGSLGLPDWANDNGDIKDPLEGFLYPGTYPAAKGMKPEAVLREMVTQAARKYDAYGLTAKAKALDLENPLQLVTVGSLVQAEGKTTDDFRKMAEVVYNRLKPTNTQTNQLLQFDSTFNYLKKESNINISESEINSNQDPYNTYTQKGLPPGPIGNPGDEAMEAALNPTADGWLYFVATDGVNKTEFAKTYPEFLRLKEKFDASTGN
jgi:UPF0755 protein